MNDSTSEQLKKISSDFMVWSDGVNSGLLVEKDSALIINPGSSKLNAVLKGMGIKRVEKILFTHHRRELADGLDEDMLANTPVIGVPEKEKKLFVNSDEYWNNPENRWHLLESHVPYHVTHVKKISVSESYKDGDVFTWRGWNFTVIETPGYTDGSVSYLAEKGKHRAIFCGDTIYGPGMVRDIYCLQHTNTENGFTVGDYHGFMGSVPLLRESLCKIKAIGADVLVPAHGNMIYDPAGAINLLLLRLDALYRNYVRVSALRWYFPKYFDSYKDDKKALLQQKTYPLPSEVRRVCGRMWILKAKDGHALLIDPDSAGSVEEAKKLLKTGEVSAFDGIWITHYHSDHVQGMSLASKMFKCPVMAHPVLAGILKNPRAYFLTCLCKERIPSVKIRKHGECWKWKEFTLTAYHLPGQTYYHDGLFVVTGEGKKYFFVGDSFSPAGIDDYCSWNRNFLGRDKGFRFCIDLVRRLKPDFMFNQHINVGFHFTDKAFKQIVLNLKQREKLISELVPWDNPNYGTDEYWIHTYPYEQEVFAGHDVNVSLKIFNHSNTGHEVSVRIELPEGWKSFPESLTVKAVGNIETSLFFTVSVPESARGGRYVLPVNVRYGSRNLGSFREAIVVVR